MVRDSALTASRDDSRRTLVRQGGHRGHAVPGDALLRLRCREVADAAVLARKLTPPMDVEELVALAGELVREHGLREEHRNFLAVLLNNALWRETVAAVPYERRIVLLPQCLRSSRDCPATMDDVGLLCRQCGRCVIGALQKEAEELGSLVLVAEGTTVVTRLLEQGQVDAVIGVSCMSTLERAFPHMADQAVPGLAIPILRDGCVDTQVDVEWVREAIHHRSGRERTGRLELEAVRLHVESWFERDALTELLGAGDSVVEQIALDWLDAGGKRFRPLLTACVYRALEEQRDFPRAVRLCALAVECFHKASLVHDDIEDDDPQRYGMPTLHCTHGVPAAINVGDLLLGDGYRLALEAGLLCDRSPELVDVIARAHRKLCVGQGRELAALQGCCPLPSDQMLEIFALKTAPAFHVALALGALCAGGDADLCRHLDQFSHSLGLAYQIRDDLDDLVAIHQGGKVALRPSVLLSLAAEHAGDGLEDLLALWRAPDGDAEVQAKMVRHILRTGADRKARQWLRHHRQEAVRRLAPIRQAPLKRLLRQLVTRLLDNEPVAT